MTTLGAGVLLRADDERHGTSAGYIAGCRCGGCRRAKTRYDKQRRWELLQTGQYRKTPTFRAVRRIHALQAMGWSVPQIARVCGISHRHLYNLDRHATCYTSTFAAVDAAYRVLSMTPPPETTTGERISVVRARKHAARQGWPVPLAWTNIDDPDEQPTDWHYRPADRHTQLDDLLEAGAWLSEVCRVLGLSVDALEKWADRNGRRADFNRLVARERGAA